MSAIVVSVFAGERPRVADRLLDTQNAVLAVNCTLERGSLRAMRGPAKSQALDVVPGTIFKHDSDGWLSWPDRVDVVKSAVLDVDGETPLGQLLMTGEREYPTMYLAGGEVYRLGIPRPSAAPTLNVSSTAALDDVVVEGWAALDASGVPGRYGSEGVEIEPMEGVTVEPFAALEAEDEGASDDGETEEEKEPDIQRSTSYCYTLLQVLADGVLRYESAPSPPTEVVDVVEGGGVTLSGFDIPQLEGLHITHIRIYRTVSGNETSDFRFLAELSLEELEQAGGVFRDTVHDKDVSSEVLQTSTWDAIPDKARGLIRTDNGIYACFRGNELLVSEPFIPYAYPSAYRLTVEDTIVALGHTDNTIVILTTGRPYLAQGGVPESLQLVHLPIEQSCVSAESVASLPGGVIYASPDGLMLMTSSEQTLITEQTMTREQWAALGPETLMGTVHDGSYVGFFRGTNRGLVFHIGRADLTRIELPEGWNVTCLYHHSEDDCVYLGAETPDGAGIWEFDAGEAMPYRWRSKEFFASALVGMSAARVSGEQNPRSPVSMNIYGPDGRRPRARIRITGGKSVRIRPMRSERVWAFELSGTADVYEARLGASVESVEYGG
ncbi:hypothetical protein [Bilophila sp.]|uniref:hypothetical protein n=1 Tax=Bilophila sp. TaxID=1929485 RepID=UPI0030774F40